MSPRIRAALELALAGAAVIGCVVSWLAARSIVAVAPLLPGEPPKYSVVYDPTLFGPSLIMAVVAGVLAIVGVARLRRR